MAFALERAYTKNRGSWKLYVNTIYFGNGYTVLKMQQKVISERTQKT